MGAANARLSHQAPVAPDESRFHLVWRPPQSLALSTRRRAFYCVRNRLLGRVAGGGGQWPGPGPHHGGPDVSSVIEGSLGDVFNAADHHVPRFRWDGHGCSSSSAPPASSSSSRTSKSVQHLPRSDKTAATQRYAGPVDERRDQDGRKRDGTGRVCSPDRHTVPALHYAPTL